MTRTLVIPDAKVDATIVTMGIDENGVMQSPHNAYDVAWYDFSARPGFGGNAVFSGHVDYHDVGDRPSSGTCATSSRTTLSRCTWPTARSTSTT